MAVVSKVPTEVWTEIFYLLCEKPIFVLDLNNSRWNEDFPWAVGLVCRQWRTTFLSHPPIWASLTLSDSFYELAGLADPETRSKSYAKEVNRRLALYLERSGACLLRLEILVWSFHNKSFTKIALKMLLACSHRWQSAKIHLYCDWPLDSILPCKGKVPTLERLDIKAPVVREYARGIFEVAPRLTHAHVEPWGDDGFILPWTQLTELSLPLDEVYVTENGDLPKLLPMLHNITELHFRSDYYEFDEGGFPQFAPTPLNQLRILEVPHPDILSWFEAPSLSHVCFADGQEDDDEPLDVHGQISSLIQRSGCRIRKLSFQSSRKFHVGTLKDVDELVIDYTHYDRIRSSIDISSLPNLRHFTIICSIDEHFKSSMKSLITALKSARVPTRSECSSETPVSLLERVTVELRYNWEEPKISKVLLEIADKWPVVVFRTQRS